VNKFAPVNDELMGTVAVVIAKACKKSAKARRIKPFENPEALFTIDMEKRFTTCFLRPFKRSKKVFIGNSLRQTYARRTDRYNKSIGEKIALVRATRNYLEESNFINL